MLSFSFQAASVEDAENGMKFMQEMIELSSKQPQDGKVYIYIYLCINKIISKASNLLSMLIVHRVLQFCRVQ